MAKAAKAAEHEFLTSGQVARMLGASTRTVARYADIGLLPSHRLPGGHRRFRHEDVEAYLAKQERVA